MKFQVLKSPYLCIIKIKRCQLEKLGQSLVEMKVQF